MQTKFSPRPQQEQSTGINRRAAPQPSGQSTGRGENLSFPESQIPKDAQPTNQVRPATPRPVIQKPNNNPFEIVPPHDSAAEGCVIGSMLMERFAVEYARELLTPESFYVPRNRALFAKCLSVYAVRGALDETILISNIGRVQDVEDVRAYVGRLIIDTPSAGNIEGYCSTVLKYQHDRARLQFALKVLSDITKARPAGQAKPKT